MSTLFSRPPDHFVHLPCINKYSLLYFFSNSILWRKAYYGTHKQTIRKKKSIPAQTSCAISEDRPTKRSFAARL